MRTDMFAAQNPFGDRDQARTGAMADPNVLADFTFDELRELPFSMQLGADLSAFD